MKIQVTRDRSWIRFGKVEETSSFTSSLKGKYLIFSQSQSLLLDICREEIENHGFSSAKVSTTDRGGEFVCCLYWHDDSRKYELAGRYKPNPELKYRYWKSNADTRAGKYSKQYINNLKRR